MSEQDMDTEEAIRVLQSLVPRSPAFMTKFVRDKDGCFVSREMTVSEEARTWVSSKLTVGGHQLTFEEAKQWVIQERARKLEDVRSKQKALALLCEKARGAA